MKILITTAAALCALAGAVAAEASPRWGGAATVQPGPAFQSGSATCGLSATSTTVSAHAAAVAGAASWALEVRAPGFFAEQSGPLAGRPVRMETLSQVYLTDGRPFVSHREGRGWARGRDDMRVANPARPLRADLVVRDNAGRVVCQDRLNLTR